MRYHSPSLGPVRETLACYNRARRPEKPVYRVAIFRPCLCQHRSHSTPPAVATATATADSQPVPTPQGDLLELRLCFGVSHSGLGAKVNPADTRDFSCVRAESPDPALALVGKWMGGFFMRATGAIPSHGTGTTVSRNIGPKFRAPKVLSSKRVKKGVSSDVPVYSRFTKWIIPERLKNDRQEPEKINKKQKQKMPNSR